MSRCLGSIAHSYGPIIEGGVTGRFRTAGHLLAREGNEFQNVSLDEFWSRSEGGIALATANFDRFAPRVRRSDEYTDIR